MTKWKTQPAFNAAHFRLYGEVEIITETGNQVFESTVFFGEAIAKMIVEAHNREIDAKEENKGEYQIRDT